MNDKLLLTRCINLLYKESLLENHNDNSKELVKSVLNKIKTTDISVGVKSESDIIDSLKKFITELCVMDMEDYNKDDILQSLKIILSDDERTYTVIEQMLNEDPSVGGLKRSIISTRKRLTDYFKELKLVEILNNASYKMKFKRDKIEDTKDFISELIASLEPLQVSTASKDPAILNDIDLSDDKALVEAFEGVKDENNGNKVYKTGWSALNRMLQGGIRPGLTTIGALQHKYKTGFSLTLFKQLALYNKPLTKDPTKKPLLLRISFEDDLNLNLQFLYQSLKYDETREYVDVRNTDTETMAKYVKDRLQVNNFYIKLLRVNPDEWTYRSICNAVIEYEAMGYNVEVLMLDYLSKIPTIGCSNTGVTGSDMCDLFNKMRNFCSARDIACITPHQLSTEAKQLIRNGMPEDQFVKQVAGLGYYQHTRSLDQIIDCELFIHVFKHQKESYLTVQRGKHRIPTIANDKDLYFILKFPKKMPIPDDREGEDQSIPSLSAITSNADDDLFN